MEARRDEIDADLEKASIELRRARHDVADLERQVQTFERLLEVAAAREGEAQTQPTLTLHLAMAQVLRGAPQRMMRAGDLAAEINRRGLYRMRDGRPVESQQIHARVGHYGHLFKRRGTFIELDEDGDE